MWWLVQIRFVLIAITYHIEVEVGPDLGQLGVRAVDLLDVVITSKLAKLLGTPKGESNGVLDLVLGESECNC